MGSLGTIYILANAQNGKKTQNLICISKKFEKKEKRGQPYT